MLPVKLINTTDIISDLMSFTSRAIRELGYYGLVPLSTVRAVWGFCNNPDETIGSRTLKIAYDAAFLAPSIAAEAAKAYFIYTPLIKAAYNSLF